MLAGDYIYLKRAHRGWTQAELARRSSIPQPNLSNIEKGKQDITLSTLRRIASAFEESLSEFVLSMESAEDRPLTRPAIERIAEQTISEEKGGDPQEENLAGLFRQILPQSSRKGNVHQTKKAWLELRLLLSKESIQAVLGRIQDAQMRSFR